MNPVSRQIPGPPPSESNLPRRSPQPVEGQGLWAHSPLAGCPALPDTGNHLAAAPAPPPSASVTPPTPWSSAPQAPCWPPLTQRPPHSRPRRVSEGHTGWV